VHARQLAADRSGHQQRQHAPDHHLIQARIAQDALPHGLTLI